MNHEGRMTHGAISGSPRKRENSATCSNIDPKIAVRHGTGAVLDVKVGVALAWHG